MTVSVFYRTVNGFCEAYGVGRTTAYELMAQGKLEFRKLGDRRLISEASAKQLFGSLPTSQHTNEKRTEADTGEQQRKRPYHRSRVPKGNRTMADTSG